MSFWQDQYGFMHEIKPGMIGFTRITGVVGAAVAAGQAFAGDGSRWTHVFGVLDNGDVIEAEPGHLGARIVSVDKYRGRADVVFCDGPVQEKLQRLQRMASQRGALVPDPPNDYWTYVEHTIRQDIAYAGRKLKGTRYGYLQYLYLGLLALRGKDGSLDEPDTPFTRWLARRIASRKTMICSQLEDQILLNAGINVFDDGRLPQNVTPGDLAIRYGVA